MTRRQLLAAVDSRELTEWAELYAVEAEERAAQSARAEQQQT